MLKRIYNILSKYIGDEVVDNVEENYYKSDYKYSHLNLVEGGSYFLTYGENTLEFPFVFHRYTPCGSGPYGQVGEGYYQKSTKKNCWLGGPSSYEGDCNFKFNKLNDQCKEFYIDILKQHFTFVEVDINVQIQNTFNDDTKCYLFLTEDCYSISITNTLEFDDGRWFSDEFWIEPIEIFELSYKTI
jgi:hypothetical protein